jgi:hypothetical protein
VSSNVACAASAAASTTASPSGTFISPLSVKIGALYTPRYPIPFSQSARTWIDDLIRVLKPPPKSSPVRSFVSPLIQRPRSFTSRPGTGRGPFPPGTPGAGPAAAGAAAAAKRMPSTTPSATGP